MPTPHGITLRMNAILPSTTATLVARTLLLMAREQPLDRLIPAGEEDLLARMLADRPGRWWQDIARRRPWLRKTILAVMEWMTPGIVAHYAARKRRIERSVREALHAGVRQVVIAGAGFDALAWRLKDEFPQVEFFELDHPATQGVKRRILKSSPSFHFVPLDLTRQLPGDALQAEERFHPGEPAVCIAEGLTMYLPGNRVQALLKDLAELAGPRGRVVFTFMQRGPLGQTGFENQHPLVSRWLSWKQEPFLWAASREELPGLLATCGLAEPTLLDDRNLREEVLSPAGLADTPLARGECLCLCTPQPEATGILCNDVHSRLNPTRVAGVVRPESAEETAAALATAAREGLAVSICGGRHAMGGQQFGEGTLLLDLTGLTSLSAIDPERGTVEAGAGLKWPELIQRLHSQQEDLAPGIPRWVIRQKQTGADDLTLGGALAANIHGRGLMLAPFIADVEAFTLIDASGRLLRCSREENPSWFRLVAGGYGCFGVVTSLCLRLVRREKLERRVEIARIDQLMPAMKERINAGATYGDFQFCIDEKSPGFLKRGILSTYHPVADDHPIPENQRKLTSADWQKLIHLAHHDRAEAFRLYSDFYLATSGGIYWSDTHQLSVYLDGYHQTLDHECHSPVPASEMITELYVPRPALAGFMAAAASDLRRRGVIVIYGTIRVIRQDHESALPWAAKDYACVIFNLHTEHSPAGIAKSTAAFQALIDLALVRGGSFYLTYHRWARPEQIEQAYPGIRDFLKEKERLDPQARFQSEWWRHLRNLFPAEQG